MRAGNGIVDGAMVIFQFNLKMLRQMIELMRTKLRHELPRERQRIERRPRRAHLQSAALNVDKPRVERSVVRDKGRVPREFQKFGQHLFDRRCVFDHGVVDARQFLNFLGNAAARVDKRIVAFAKLAVIDDDRADLDDRVDARLKARRLDVEDAIAPVDRKRRRIVMLFVVDQIRLDPRQHLDARAA